MIGATSSIRYNAVAKFLHWFIALAIFIMLVLGWVMAGLPDSTEKFALFQWHKSIGITILLLSLIRVVWRFMNPPPPMPVTVPRWEAKAAYATHYAFYTLMIAMPLLGWIMVSASPLNLPTLLFKTIPWPHLPVIPTLDNKKEIGHLATRMHGCLAYVLAALIVLHIGAACKHHLIEGDEILTRMAPNFMTNFLNRLRRRRSLGIAALVVLLSGSSAQAKIWAVDYPHSQLGFIGAQGSTPFEGSFNAFQTTIDFDPAIPENGKISARIDMASATTGNGERDAPLPQADWFDTKKFPQAIFASTAIRKTGDNAYAADGNLTIKGITKPITLPFTLTQDGGYWRARGRLTLLRTDFHIGEHDWANETYVKFKVDIVLNILAKAAS